MPIYHEFLLLTSCSAFSVEDSIQFQIALAGMELEAVTQLFFNKPDVSVDDVLNVFDVKYDYKTFHSLGISMDVLLNYQGQVIRRANGTWEGFLPELLRRSGTKFLREFLRFVTGSSYVPYTNSRTDYWITIEFNGTEEDSAHAASLPVCHSCAKTIKLPPTAYSGDQEIFEKKLKQSMEYSEYVGFDMS